MLEWSFNPWLLTTDIEEHEGQYYVDGNLVSRWKWSSVCGAERHWQHRGGSITRLSSGNIVTEWILACEKDCKRWLEEPEKVVAHKVPRQKVSIEDSTWFNTKDAWPRGIGAKALRALAVYIAEEWGATNIKGWGKKTVANVRTWYGVVESSPTSTWEAKSACLIFSGEGNERGNDVTT
jgi:hypothetical protein